MMGCSAVGPGAKMGTDDMESVTDMGTEGTIWCYCHLTVQGTLNTNWY